MMIRKRTGVAILAMVAVVLMGRPPLVAQEPASAPKPAATAPRKKADPAHRVPDYFGQIGLTTEQRASIYNLQGKRIEKIDALKKQIAAERAEMLAECEGVLTETQRKLYDNLRRVAAESNARPAEVPKPAN